MSIYVICCRDDPTIHSQDLETLQTNLAAKPMTHAALDCCPVRHCMLCYAVFFLVFIAAGMTQPFTIGTLRMSHAVEIKSHDIFCFNMPCSVTSCYVVLFPLVVAAGMTQPFTPGTLQTSHAARVITHAVLHPVMSCCSLCS
jgi:hypothetical protein